MFQSHGCSSKLKVSGKHLREKVLGNSMKGPWKQPKKDWSRSLIKSCIAGTQWGVPHCISTYWHPLRWTGNASGVPSPCYDKLKLLVTEVDTHRVPISALWRNLLMLDPD